MAAFSDDIQADLALIQVAIMLVAIYTIVVLGTFSPLHCRLVVSLMGLVSVGLSYASGFGICFYLGGETAGVHNLMPFLLIGIGVDDMFVICNAVDQTDLKAKASDRIRKAIEHAGPSITITSLTNALAFAFGSMQSLTSLRSFCIFASACIMMLYFTVMTFFLCVVVWDTERVGLKRGECCGLCMCKEDTVICCKGSCLSKKMKNYSDVDFADDKPAASKNDEEKQKQNSTVDERNEQLEASCTERFIEKNLGPCLMTKGGRIGLLILYLVLVALSVYGCTQVKIDFKVTYFIGEESTIYDYFQLNDKYFNSGTRTTTYVDNPNVDYSSAEI